MPGRIWEKASRAVTSDNAGLAILGATALVRAVSYAPWFVNADRTPAHWLEGLLPAPAWSVVWLLIAVACMAAIITPRLLPDRKSTRLNSSHIEESRMPSSA